MDGIDNAIYTMIVIGMCTAYVTVFAFIFERVRAEKTASELVLFRYVYYELCINKKINNQRGIYNE